MTNTKLSRLAENLTSFSISKLSEKIDEKIKNGEKIFNFTLGDFSPLHFPIPQKLETEIIAAYRDKHTNYPFVGGMAELRIAIAKHINLHGQFDYEPDEIIVSSGARPLIYLLFKTLVNPGEKIIYTVPSWNNQYFIYLANAEPIIVAAKPENNFVVTAAEIKPYLKDAALITINSPLNPSGTAFHNQSLMEIFDLIIAENDHRAVLNQKPLYIFFDAIYWLLTYNDVKFTNPVLLCPKIKDYVIFVDGISKCFAATGVRLGWAFGPKPIIEKMRSMLSHIGAWAPKPEQIGTARFLQQHDEVNTFLATFKHEIFTRLNIFYTAMQKLKIAGHKVDAIEPQGAIYLTVKFDLMGLKTADNKMLKTVGDVTNYLLEEGKVALVPFYLFGADENLPWFRLSVGTCSIDDAEIAAKHIEQAVKQLKSSG